VSHAISVSSRLAALDATENMLMLPLDNCRSAPIRIHTKSLLIFVSIHK